MKLHPTQLPFYDELLEVNIEVLNEQLSLS